MEPLVNLVNLTEGVGAKSSKQYSKGRKEAGEE